MGCGKSAWDDDIETSIYQRKKLKLEEIKNFGDNCLISKLDRIKDLSENINKETSSGSRYLFRLLDGLIKEVDWERWNKD